MLVCGEHAAGHDKGQPASGSGKGLHGVRQKHGCQLHLRKQALRLRRNLVGFNGSKLDFLLIFGIGDIAISDPGRIADDDVELLPQHGGPVTITDDERPDGVLLLLNQFAQPSGKIPESGDDFIALQYLRKAGNSLVQISVQGLPRFLFPARPVFRDARGGNNGIIEVVRLVDHHVRQYETAFIASGTEGNFYAAQLLQ